MRIGFSFSQLSSRILKPLSAWEEAPTFILFVGCLVFWGLALMLPVGWAGLGFLILVLSLVLHSSLSHEILHGHPFRKTWACTALALVQLGLFIPYLRFKEQHLAHHHDERLTDPYDDPESNYLDPARWAGLSERMRLLLRVNNTLLGRMVVGPALGMVHFVAEDLRLIRNGDQHVLRQWLLHLPGVVLVLWLVNLSAMSAWTYLAACYCALSVLKIRTFLEHRAHERASARTVVIEDRGILAFLFLNNNFHVVHHMHPQVCWYQLPGLYLAHKDRFLRRNQGYVYRSYGQIFRSYLLRAKDPVAHPLWRGSQR